MEDRVVKKLLTSMKCDACGQHYEAYNIDILGHREDLWFLRVHCSACHTQSLLAAVIREEGVSGEVTDLTETEKNKFAGSVIEADDVLDVHNFLNDFDGDFSRLFSPE